MAFTRMRIVCETSIQITDPRVEPRRCKHTSITLRSEPRIEGGGRRRTPNLSTERSVRKRCWNRACYRRETTGKHYLECRSKAVCSLPVITREQFERCGL